MAFQFNPANVAESETHDALPDGVYPVEVTASEWKATKAGTGHYAQIEFTVMGENRSGRKVWVRFNLDNPNPKAVDIAEREFKDFTKAAGHEKAFDDISLPVGWMLQVLIGKGDREGENDVKKFLPLKGGNEPSGNEFPPPAREPDEVVAASSSDEKPWG